MLQYGGQLVNHLLLTLERHGLPLVRLEVLALLNELLLMLLMHVL